MDRAPRNLAGRLLAIIAATAAASSVAAVAVLSLRGPVGLALAVAAAAVTYATAIWWLNRRFRLELLTDARRVFPEIEGLISFAPGGGRGDP